MIRKLKNKKMVDLGLYLIFVATFFLDLTGVILHEWLGMIAGAIAIYHLAMHWKWVVAAIRQFFRRASGKTRLYSLVDAGLLLGLLACVVTGLAISTWLNLASIDYEAWRTAHLVVSIATALVTLMKVGLHWSWILKALSKRVKIARVSVSAREPQSVLSMQRRLDRRGFLKVVGITGVVTILAASRALEGLAVEARPVAAGKVLAQESDSQPSAAETSAVELGQTAETALSPNVLTSTESPTLTATNVQATDVPTEVATAVLAQSQATAVSACSIRCPRGCSFPGRCRRYVDSNANNRCDLGECL
jgi:hypothetical protein